MLNVAGVYETPAAFNIERMCLQHSEHVVSFLPSNYSSTFQLWPYTGNVAKVHSLLVGVAILCIYGDTVKLGYLLCTIDSTQ